MKALKKFYQNYWHELWFVAVILVINCILLKFGCPHCTPRNWLLFGIVSWFVVLVFGELFTPRCSWRYEGAFFWAWMVCIVISCVTCFVWMYRAYVPLTAKRIVIIALGYVAVCVIGLLLQKLNYRLFDEKEDLNRRKEEYIRKNGIEAYNWHKK